MKKLKKIKETIKEHYKIDKEYCDICEKEYRHGYGYDCSGTTLKVKVGDSWPEGDMRDTYELDLCVDCFLDKVKPLIEEEFNCEFLEGCAEDTLEERYKLVN